MASSFYSNSQHIDFASVLAMNDPGMVSLFPALIASGPEGFLGCPEVVYQTALVDFFENASVRDGVIISTVAGQLVEISEEWFAEMFEMPVDGLEDVSEMPKDKIFDAKSIVSMTGEPVILSGLKSQMKIHYLLLCDYHGENYFREGRVFQRHYSREVFVGDSSCFWKEATGAPKPKAASKKRHAADVGVTVAKKNRTIKKKSVTSHSTLEMVAVAQEAVPIQMVEASAVDKVTGEVGVEEVAAEIDTSADMDKPADTNEERQWFDLSHDELIAKWAAERIVTTPDDTDEEIKAERPVFRSAAAVEPVGEVSEAAADKDLLFVNDPDTVINQVPHHLDSISADKDDKSSDRAATWFDSALDEMLRNDEGAETMDLLDEQSASSSRSDEPMHFDKDDIPLIDTADIQTSLPIGRTEFVEAVDDLRAFLLQRVDDSNSAILSKLHTL
ncbi:hypothetical protein F511_22146 [Dorcoceras hygrometricum]|uniref:Dystroglycan-like n=1 Tax=Dorcoceras hygrometricum TaxID=472368 RepID=A0A2Z7B348_9LAMI|nr:hypothetical protein F511_22146 [Dorcoceras hygrometricum]